MADILNWSKFKTYEGDQRKSFERLCYAIAKGLHKDKGIFFPVDDSGGGDGVEFFLRFPNGDEWGWQCKFFYPEARLDNEKSRKEQIKSSLSTACRKHPNLKKFFLCLPTDFTTAEREWYFDTLPTTKHKGESTIPNSHQVELESWPNSDLITFLAMEQFAGLRHAFFDSLTLSIDWFRGRVQQTLANVGDKYLPELHTESYVDRELWLLTGSMQSQEMLRTSFSMFEKYGTARFGKHSDFFKLSEQLGDSTEACEHARELLTSLDEVLDELRASMAELEQPYFEGRFSELPLSKPKNSIDSLRKQLDELNKYCRSLKMGDRDLHPDGYRGDGSHYLPARVGVAASIMGNAWNCALGYLNQMSLCQNTSSHVIGEAGLGKTHLVCHLADTLTRTGKPAILILGRSLGNADPLQTQILKFLDVPSNYGWTDFLSALQAVGEHGHRCRIPIIIDGLNESTDSGLLSDVWFDQLAGLEESLKPFSHVCLITTCRRQYRQRVFNDNRDWSFLDLPLQYGADELIRRYFEIYKIRADVRFASLQHLRHPLYLRLFCEVENPAHREPVSVYLGEESLFATFDKFFETANDSITRKLRRRDGIDSIKAPLERFCRELWAKNSRSVTLPAAARLIDQQPLEGLDWDRALTHYVESEGLLFCRSFDESDEEAIGFTYDLLAGYLIARALVGDVQTQNQLAHVVSDENLQAKLYGDRLHPLNEDIRRGINALLASKGLLLTESISDSLAIFDTIRAIYEIKPSQISDRLVSFLREKFEDPKHRIAILRESELAWTHPGHPAGADFLEEELRKLSLADRDASWSYFLLESHAMSWADELETVAKAQTSDDSNQRIHLAAQRVMWTLTSTNRPLRDHATRALYWYGRQNPVEFFKLVLSSLPLNDPYIWERMLAAAYGVLMALQYDGAFIMEHLGLWARELYAHMFVENAPYPTTHILARDYASRIVRRGKELTPDALQGVSEARVRSPFPTEFHRDWPELPFGEFEGLSLSSDFANYTCDRLVPGRGSYNYDHPEYRSIMDKICGRIGQLGWSSGTLGPIDRKIQSAYNELTGYHDEKRIERFAKKYAWIAFYEMAGEREDRDELKQPYDDVTEQRWSQGDIDPSFPSPPGDLALVGAEVLQDTGTSTEAWLNAESLYDPTSLWQQTSVLDEDGPWLLLTGGFTVEDTSADRSVWVNFASLFVHEDDGQWACQQLESHQPNLSQDLRSPVGLRTFVGEVPWSDTFPKNKEPDAISFREDESQLEFLPVAWNLLRESINSSANPNFAPLYPSGWLVEELCLRGTPDTCDLFDLNGRRASRYVEHSSDGKPMRRQHYLYLRADLITELCQRKSAVLVQVLQGVRGYSMKSALGFNQLGNSWKELERPFYHARFYPEGQTGNDEE